MKKPILLLVFPLVFPLLSWSRSVAGPEELLFSPTALPEFHVVSLEAIRAGGSVSAAQVTLTDGEIDLFHSVVVFPTESKAGLALVLTVDSLSATGAQIAEGPDIEEDSAILLGQDGARNADSFLLRKEPVLTRLTLARSLSQDRVVEYGRATVAKIRH